MLSTTSCLASAMKLGSLQFVRALSSAGPGARVGFIGLGRMGFQMVTRLLDAGHRVVVYDANPFALNRAVAVGKEHPSGVPKALEAAGSAAEVAASDGVDVVFTMLPSVGTVKEVYLGPNGILSLKGGPRASLFVDCSTTDPQTARKIAAAADKTKLHKDAHPIPGLMVDTPCFLDAPVSGGVLGAEAATLSFMVGGDKPAIKLAEPLLKIMGHHITVCGDHGTGQAARLCTALVMACSMAAVSESIALGRRLGLDPALLTQVLNSSSARCWASESYNPVPGLQSHAPSTQGYKAGLRVDLLIEQLKAAASTAEHVESPAHCAHNALKLYQMVHDEGVGDMDFSSIFRYVYGSGISDSEWSGGEKLFGAQIP